MLRRAASLLLLVLFAAFAAGCATPMVQSTGAAAGTGEGCKSNAGAYRLPKRLMSVKVTSASDNKSFALTVNDEDVLVSDSSESFCLDFLFSVLANDRIGLQRSPNQLLQRIFTRAEDKSKPLAEAMIRAAGDLVAAQKAGGLLEFNRARSVNQQQQDGTANTVVSLQFDPFDADEMRAANAALRPVGYCLYLDGGDDSFVPGWHGRQLCGGKERHGGGSSESSLFGLAAGHKLMHKGILYRPEISHRLMVLRKLDPENPREAWHLAATEYVTMPNGAPVFALGINRTMFVTMTTNIEFESGLLKNVTIHRPSELNAAVDLPLYAAQVALSVPAAVLAIFENQSRNRQQLMKTNADLIDTLRSMKRDVEADQVRLQGLQQLGISPDAGALPDNAPAAGSGAGAEASRARLAKLSLDSCLANAVLTDGRDPNEACRDEAAQQ
jgi:hypothetical protein